MNQTTEYPVWSHLCHHSNEEVLKRRTVSKEWSRHNSIDHIVEKSVSVEVLVILVVKLSTNQVRFSQSFHHTRFPPLSVNTV